MEWLNLHSSTLDDPAVIGSGPIERATWLFLLRLCIGQENGGRIPNCKAWADRKWQQVARVTAREVQRKTCLWSWHGDDLVVAFYPIEKEQEVRRNRENGNRGGRPRVNQVVSQVVNRDASTGIDSAVTEGKGKERKGIEGKANPQPTLNNTNFLDTPDDEITLSKPLPPVPSRNLPDFLAICPGLHVSKDNRPDWEAALRHWGWEPMCDAATTLHKQKNGQPVWHNEITSWLAANYELKK